MCVSLRLLRCTALRSWALINTVKQNRNWVDISSSVRFVTLSLNLAWFARFMGSNHNFKSVRKDGLTVPPKSWKWSLVYETKMNQAVNWVLGSNTRSHTRPWLGVRKYAHTDRRVFGLSLSAGLGKVTTAWNKLTSVFWIPSQFPKRSVCYNKQVTVQIPGLEEEQGWTAYSCTS